MDADDGQAMDLSHDEEGDVEVDEDGELQGQDRYPIEYPPVDPRVMRAVRVGAVGARTSPARFSHVLLVSAASAVE